LVAHTSGGGSSPVVKRHAALFRVKYGAGKRDSVLLYVKASLSGDEPSDVQQYHAEHSAFPHESTADQFFGEAQWESYRRLGEHIGDAVLGPMAEPPTASEPLWVARLKQ